MGSEQQADEAVTRQKGRTRDRLKGFSRSLFGNQGSVRRPIVFLAVAVAISSLVSPAFFGLANLRVLLTSSSFLVVLAAGEALVVLVGGIDLGVESMLAASGMLAAWLYVFRQSTTAVSIILTLAFGAAVGVIDRAPGEQGSRSIIHSNAGDLLGFPWCRASVQWRQLHQS